MNLKLVAKMTLKETELKTKQSELRKKKRKKRGGKYSLFLPHDYPTLGMCFYSSSSNNANALLDPNFREVGAAVDFSGFFVCEVGFSVG